MNIFLRPEEAMIEIWQKLVFQQFNCCVFEKIIQLTKNIITVMVFMDFIKAFDSIERVKLGAILEAYGITKEMVKAIMIQYTDIFPIVRSPGDDMNFFQAFEGVLHGDALAAHLFNICLSYVLCQALDWNIGTCGFTLEQLLNEKQGIYLIICKKK